MEVPRPIPFHLLEEITNGFSEERKLGVGSYGHVYKGVHQDGQKIAVNLLHPMPGLDDEQFEREYGNLANLQHHNIVRLVGYCHESRREYVQYNGKMVLAESTKRALCFEYMHNGSLDNYLQDESSGHNWQTRYSIIKGICMGLKYLHEDLQPPLYHLDLKPANILLDENMNPKIADFGLSTLFTNKKTRTSMSPIGTCGYLPPEYVDYNVVSDKLDIYSLGVIIIKIMVGSSGYSESADMSCQEFIEHVHMKWTNRIQVESIDEQQSYAEQVRTCIELALSCVEVDRSKRPQIGYITSKLNDTETVAQLSAALTINPVSRSVEEQNELLDVHSRQLCFPCFEPNKKISCPLCLCNKTDNDVAFRLLPKLPENYIDGLSELKGILPPRSTHVYHVWMEKQPPENLEEFAVTIENCIAHKNVVGVDDNFLPEILEKTGSTVHEVTVMGVIRDPVGQMVASELIRPGMTKVIGRIGKDQRGHLTEIDVHPTEPWIVASYYRGGIIIWNYETQERVTVLRTLSGTENFRSTKFIARKDWFLAGDWYGWIHVRSCKTNDEINKFKAHRSVVISLAVHPSDPLLLSSGIDPHIKLWNWEENWTCIRTFGAGSVQVEKVMFNPMYSNIFASIALDGKVKIWRTSSPLPVTTLDCHQQLLTADYFCPGGDRQYMITGSSSGNAQIWDLNVDTPTCIRQINGLITTRNVGVLDCFPDRQLIVTTLPGNVISLYNFSTDMYGNTVDFNHLGGVFNFAYIKRIKSAAIGFHYGIALMEIN